MRARLNPWMKQTANNTEEPRVYSGLASESFVGAQIQHRINKSNRKMNTDLRAISMAVGNYQAAESCILSGKWCSGSHRQRYIIVHDFDRPFHID